jgi:hypothetical protein
MECGNGGDKFVQKSDIFAIVENHGDTQARIMNYELMIILSFQVQHSRNPLKKQGF